MTIRYCIPGQLVFVGDLIKKWHSFLSPVIFHSHWSFFWHSDWQDRGIGLKQEYGFGLLY